MIIGLSGYARSGKDEVAKILVEEYGYTRVAFADKIRELLLETNPLIKDGFRMENVVSAYGWDQAKVLFPEIRKLLQNLGVGARKTFCTEFWVAQALSQVHFEGDYVITDVRFINEADRIKQYDNAQLWRVTRPGVDAVNNHISEHDLDNYSMDTVIKNEGTLDDLRQLVHKNMEIVLNAK